VQERPAHRLPLLVAGVVLLGLGLSLAVVLLFPSATTGPVPVPGWLDGPWLLPGLVALTCLGELTYVRLRHRGVVEELALLEAAVVVDVLLLPPRHALAVAALGLGTATALRRRAPVKALFNLGTYTAASAVLVLVVHEIAPHESGFSAQLVAAMTLGTVGFATVNLCCLALVLSLVSGVGAGEVVRDEWRLSAVMALGTAALGSTAVAIAGSSPALLPFTALPAAALTYAYRARAQEADERERSSRLLALSQVLAGRLDSDELVSTFLALASDAYDTDAALVVLEPDAPGGQVTAVTVRPDGVPDDARRPATVEHVALLALAGSRPGAQLVQTGLPAGWRRALVAPLEAEGRRLGVLVLATASRRGQLTERDVTQLTPLAGALAVALRGADHLGQLVTETGKLKAVVEQSSDGILVLDGEGVVQLWSPALAGLTGVRAPAAVGRALSAVLSAVDAAEAPVDAFAHALSVLNPTSPRVTLEMGLRRDDGEIRWTRCSHAAVFDRDVLVRDVVIVHDVTRERQVDRLKSDFIATVSHELRTPVTPIKGYAELLLRRGDAMTPEKRRECLDFIVERTGHLARLVEDLLLASRISAGTDGPAHSVRLGADDLVALIRRATADFTSDGERLRVRLPAGTAAVHCDPTRAVQVLGNLVGNALKYSTPGSAVEVLLTLRNGYAAVDVTDSGRGIPADQLDKVFEKFHRVEDPLRMTTSGTGLGLYIARQLAQAMGGTLTARSTLGVGSTFTFTLPLAAQGSAEDETVDDVAIAGHGRSRPGAS